MDWAKTLQDLLDGTASEDEIHLLRQALVSGEISIGGNVNQSVIIIGSGNTVELTPAALDRLNARPMLGNLDRDLTGEEIASGLKRLEELLPNRAPVLISQFKGAVARLRPTLKTEIKALSETSRRERLEALAAINSICVEAVDVSFNGLCLGEEAPDYDARSPFRGLESFRPEDSEFFFGREVLTEKLIGKIKARSFLAVLGASGSGKSSLVMAGVIPTLASDYVIFRPGTNPLDELESARGKPLIVVDQFEELFTLTRDEFTRKDFIARLLDESTRARIILTLRSDFLGEVGAYRTLSAEIQNHLEIVPPMDMDELRCAMEGQAGVTGLRFEADLSQQILDDVAGEPGAMPLLQHALWELWNRRHGRNLRASEYRAFGGVKQAITSTAEKVYADCSKPEQDQLRDIFLRLTRLDEGDEGRDTRRRVPLGDLIPSGRDAASMALLLDKLANARLIVKTVNDDKTEVEVAHEALIRHWERLRLWLNEDRDALRLRESVSESAKEWEKSGKHESLLNSRWVKLDEALLLVQDSRYRLTEIEQAYLKGCVALRNREQGERERRRKITLASAIAVIVTIMAILVGWGISSTKSANANATQVSINSTQVSVANTAQANAEEQANLALSRLLINQSKNLNLTDRFEQETSLLLAIQSMRLLPSSDSFEIMQASNLTSPISHMKHEHSINKIDFNPDGNYLVSGSEDTTLRVWESFSGRELSVMKHGNGAVEYVAFSPDGRYIVSRGCVDQKSAESEVGWLSYCVKDSVIIWSENGKETKFNSVGTSIAIFNATGKYLALISKNGEVDVLEAESWTKVSHISLAKSVDFAAFSPSGKYLAVSERDTIFVFSVDTGEEVSRIVCDYEVKSFAFNASEDYLVSLENASIYVWGVKDGQKITHLAFGSSANAFALSPDGKYVVSAGCDNYDSYQKKCTRGLTNVWEISTGEKISLLMHGGNVNSVNFSPNGKYVVSGGDDNTARVWETDTGKEITYILHNGDVNVVAFSPDGDYVVSGDSDGVIFLWKAIRKKVVTQILHTSPVSDIAFSPDGKYIISGGQDKSAWIFNVSTGVETAHLTHGAYVSSVTFSPDGRYAATGGCDTTDKRLINFMDTAIYCSSGSARVWEVETGKEISRMPHNEHVWGIAFSPDSHYVVSGDVEGAIYVWEAKTGKEIAHMVHQDSIRDVYFSSDGESIVSASDDGLSCVWNVETGREMICVKHASKVTSARLSHDDKYVISSEADGTVHIWNTFTGGEISRISHREWVTSFAISSDDKYIVSGSNDGTVYVSELITGKRISSVEFNGHVYSVDFSPDGRYIAVGEGCDNMYPSYSCESGVSYVLNAITGQEIYRMKYNGIVSSIAFSPNGQYVASGSYDGVVEFWTYSPEDLIAEFCLRVTRNLTRAEWDQYIGDALPYQAVCPNLPIEPEPKALP